METILQHAQGLVYALLHLMPSRVSAEVCAKWDRLQINVAKRALAIY